MSPATEHLLEATLQRFEEAESTQIVVLTIPSLAGDALEDFSIRVAEQWKIGRKGRDNGAILVVAKAERKLRIEVGYGLEGRLTDAVSGRIIRTVIVPEFKAGRFEQGIINGVNAMIQAVQGEFRGRARRTRCAEDRRRIGCLLLYRVVFSDRPSGPNQPMGWGLGRRPVGTGFRCPVLFDRMALSAVADPCRFVLRVFRLDAVLRFGGRWRLSRRVHPRWPSHQRIRGRFRRWRRLQRGWGWFRRRRCLRGW